MFAKLCGLCRLPEKRLAYMFGFEKSGVGFVALVSCADGKISKTSNFPVSVGGDGELGMPGIPEIFSVGFSGGKYRLDFFDSGESVFFNGVRLSGNLDSIPPVSTLQAGESLFYLVVGDSKSLERLSKIDVSKWLVFFSDSGRVEDEVPFSRIRPSVEYRGLDGSGIAFCPKGFELGFMYSQVFGDSSGAAESANFIPSISDSDATITCPMCWLKFDVGDAFSIASHESLRGDPVLGPEEMLRFLPVSFNSDGIPLDPAGMPAPDVACPHCRKKLPLNYIELDRRIFSIVGAPSAGKTYYLSVLIKELQDSLYKNFGIAFKDMDPTGNMLLIQMKNKLFSARRPEEAILAKTVLEGVMYERYPRFGKMVALPKPLSYSLSNGEGEAASVIFYDNAGEHFEPGLDIEESPGALHVASSDAIFFLFDPAANREFKGRLGDYPDPQLTIGGRFDQQDTILSEMEVRIKRILSLEPTDRIKVPLAVLIGKCDMWLHLLGEKLSNPLSKEGLDMGIIDSNSDIIRNFMTDIAPSIVAGALSISDDVRFFAVSALGHSPVLLTEGECAGKIAPVPEKLSPMNVEIPALWALSRVTKLIPVK